MSPTPGVVAVMQGSLPRFNIWRGRDATLMRIGAWACALLALSLLQVPKWANAAAPRPSRQALSADDRANSLPIASRFTAVGIAHLAVGMPLLTIGSFARRTVYVPDQTVGFTFEPVVSPNRIGAGFALSF